MRRDEPSARSIRLEAACRPHQLPLNLASSNEGFLHKSMQAFRGEVERALALCVNYLVLHPGSFRGADREEGLLRTAAAIAASTQGLDLAKGGLTILIEILLGRSFPLGAASSKSPKCSIDCGAWCRLPHASIPAIPMLPAMTS